MATATKPTRVRQPDSSLADRYRRVRLHTERLCQPLKTEDYDVSSMPDVSPTKWHLAHTSWFFETFVLAPHDADYVTPNPKYALVFNSHDVRAGERLRRAQRALVTHPTIEEVFAYRHHVDEHMLKLIERDDDPDVSAVIELGLHHEQQHQELLLADVKHVFWTNPLKPAYIRLAEGGTQNGEGQSASAVPSFFDVPEGVYLIGCNSDRFAFDNETPAHHVFVERFRLASQLVTNGEYLAFIEDGGYRRPELWRAAGWAVVHEQRREAPIYWERTADGWTEFTLAGTQPLDVAAPVSHVSYYEADAFARWASARLPNEAEWEIAAREAPVLPQIFGRRWQWTQSAYDAYPGYVPDAGALGEYSGEWMSGQWVLRGSSSATPPGHSRVTYRNFFPSDTRWQFTGIRLAAS